MTLIERAAWLKARMLARPRSGGNRLVIATTGICSLSPPGWISGKPSSARALPWLMRVCIHLGRPTIIRALPSPSPISCLNRLIAASARARIV